MENTDPQTGIEDAMDGQPRAGAGASGPDEKQPGPDAYPDTIQIGEYVDPETQEAVGPAELPLVDALSSRVFIAGQTGAGKSNTVNVLAEEILRAKRPLAIIDPEGEYWGLKEEFPLLHVGKGDDVDVEVGPEHGEILADICLSRHRSVILDISAYTDREVADDLVASFVRALFQKENTTRTPFPLIVEEAHTYVPQQGSVTEAGQEIIKAVVRGRKRGLGTIAVSQRPQKVDKDVFSQADTTILHRLGYDASYAAKQVAEDAARRRELEAALRSAPEGRAAVVAEWTTSPDESAPAAYESASGRQATGESVPWRWVQVRRQDTYDAGDRPSLADEEVPEFRAIDSDLIDEIKAATDAHTGVDEVERLQDRIETLEAENAELRDELDQRAATVETFRGSAEQFATAIEQELSGLSVDFDGNLPADGDQSPVFPDRIQTQVMEVIRETAAEQLPADAADPDLVDDLRAEVDRLSAALEERTEQVAELEATVENLREERAEARRAADRATARADRLDARLDAVQAATERLTAVVSGDVNDVDNEADGDGESVPTTSASTSPEGETDHDSGGDDHPEGTGPPHDESPLSFAERLDHEEVRHRLTEAADGAKASRERFVDVIVLLAEVHDGDHPRYRDEPGHRPDVDALLERLPVKNRSTVYMILNNLSEEGVALVETVDADGKSVQTYRLNTDLLGDIDALDASQNRRQQRDTVRTRLSTPDS